MIEISYLTQDGEKIYLKDAKGRESLNQKQNKLKAGNGISIAADGTISATGAGGGNFKKYTAEGIHLTSDNDSYPYNENDTYRYDVTYSLEFSYYGNLALLNSVICGDSSYSEWEHMQSSGWGNFWTRNSKIFALNKIKTIADSDFNIKGVDATLTGTYGDYTIRTSAVQTAAGMLVLFGYLADNETFEDTGEDYLYIITEKVTGKGTNDDDYKERESKLIFYFEDTGETMTDDNNGKTYRCTVPSIVGRGLTKDSDWEDSQFSNKTGQEFKDHMDNTWNFELYGYHGWYDSDGVRSDEHIKDWPMLIGEVLGLI
jgi:hypothetical protein